ncbi:MAG: hypothetical protein KF771_03275 [Burkholderiales bacterium]|nr:hypothetical protein [Burkholderiales bacterium]
MHEPNEIISAAEEIGATFETLLEEVEVQDSGEARISACLFLTIAELYIAMLSVMRSRAQSHAPVLVRSMHEAFVDLQNLVADSSYADQMRFDNADQMLKTSDGFQAAPDMQDNEEALRTLAEWSAKEQKTWDELKGMGYKPLRVFDKFNRVGMAGEYTTSYRFFCSFSHSDLNTLIARHAGIGHLRFTDPLPAETLKSVLSIAINIYGRGVQRLPKFTNVSDDKVKVAVDTAEAIWKPI